MIYYEIAVLFLFIHTFAVNSKYNIHFSIKNTDIDVIYVYSVHLHRPTTLKPVLQM